MSKFLNFPPGYWKTSRNQQIIDDWNFIWKNLFIYYSDINVWVLISLSLSLSLSRPLVKFTLAHVYINRLFYFPSEKASRIIHKYLISNKFAWQ